MTVYNKLVRDRIPEIIEAQGEKANVRVLEEADFLVLLEEKLDEEVGEFHRDRNIEELADILEVVYALADSVGSREELDRVYRKKHEDRGGFEERVFLISKETVLKRD